jgi:hypothetical protein
MWETDPALIFKYQPQRLALYYGAAILGLPGTTVGPAFQNSLLFRLLDHNLRKVIDKNFLISFDSHSKPIS